MCVYKKSHWKINGNSILMDANHNQWIEKERERERGNDGGEQVVLPEAMREPERKKTMAVLWWPFKCLGGITESKSQCVRLNCN